MNDSTAQGAQPSRILYGWILVGVTTLVLMAAAGVVFSAGRFPAARVDQPRLSTGRPWRFSVSLGLLLYGAAGSLLAAPACHDTIANGDRWRGGRDVVIMAGIWRCHICTRPSSLWWSLTIR